MQTIQQAHWEFRASQVADEKEHQIEKFEGRGPETGYRRASISGNGKFQTVSGISLPGRAGPHREEAMRTSSVFCAECICGLHIETPARELICPNCKRLIVFEWGVADADNAQRNSSDEKTESETVA